MQLLHGAYAAIQKLKGGEATLIHCTDGWDRTAQITGLVQVTVDPACRTIRGFQELVQKEWCDAGHQFAMRCGHIPHAKMDETAPIFGQFIDAVYQLVMNWPDAFQFNEKFLAFILFHSYSQLFGDFLGNCYRERTEKARPPSIWSAFKDLGSTFARGFCNPGFVESLGEIDPCVREYKWSALIFESPLAGCNGELPQFLDLPEAPETPAFVTAIPLAEDESESESEDLEAGLDGGEVVRTAELDDE
jgi:hypothetical protein